MPTERPDLRCDSLERALLYHALLVAISDHISSDEAPGFLLAFSEHDRRVAH
jgi:hypothetical protein